jgi:hypothetical protein
MDADEDFTQLDDPAFLAERRRARDLPEGTLTDVQSSELTERRRQLDEEFSRRASAAWSHAS